MPSIEEWAEWKEKCALGLCRCETRTALQSFAYARFYHFAVAYAKTTNTPDPKALTPEPSHAWHDFETHLRLRDTREGKRFKDWLFAPLDGSNTPTLDSVQRGATVIMRDVVRERLRREFSSHLMRSLDAPAGRPDDGQAPALKELLAGPLDTAQEVEQRELERLAAGEADSAMAGLNQRERIALLARELGLSLACPSVIQAAGCGKSVLNTAYHKALQRLANHVRSAYSREDKATLAFLTILVFHDVRQRILSWGRSENATSQLCMIVDERTT